MFVLNVVKLITKRFLISHLFSDSVKYQLVEDDQIQKENKMMIPSLQFFMLIPRLQLQAKPAIPIPPQLISISSTPISHHKGKALQFSP